MVLASGSATERADDPPRHGSVDLPVAAVLETVLDRSGVGIVVFDAAVRFRLVNEAAAEINGIPAAEHLGRRLADVLPEIAPEVEPVVREVFRTGTPTVGAEVTGVTPAEPGRMRSWVVSYARVPAVDGDPGGVALVFSETTAIRRAEQRLRDVIDGLFSFVAVLDPQGGLAEINQSALAVSGLTAEAVIGLPFWDGPWWTYDPEVRERMRAAVAEAAGGTTVRFDVDARIDDDRRLPIDFQIVPLVEDGVITALVPSGIDITDRVRAGDRARSSAQLARALAAASTTGEIVAAVVERAAEVVSAVGAGVALADEHGVLSLAGATPGAHVGPDDLPVAAEAVRRPGTVHLADRSAVDRSTPAGPAAAVALQLPDGSAFGALVVRWAPGADPGAVDRDDLQALADLVAQAIARARLADAHLELAQMLRATLLGEVVAADPLDVATAYVPASEQLNFGGDWHDVIDLGGGCTAFVIGDVVGHGVVAATRMARFHTVIDTLVRQGTPPGEVFRRTQGLLAHIDTGFVATAALAVVDTASETLTYVAAGHPPPVVRHPDGTVEVLEGGRRP